MKIVRKVSYNLFPGRTGCVFYEVRVLFPNESFPSLDETHRNAGELSGFGSFTSDHNPEFCPCLVIAYVQQTIHVALDDVFRHG